MSDLINRQDAINILRHHLDEDYLDGYVYWNELKAIPSADVTEIIRCQDCKWWNRLEDDHPYGYCRACRSGTHTERWDISIRRQCKYDFYCADAEPKN